QRIERIIEEAGAIVDPREPRAGQKIGSQNLMPEALDQRHLGVEPVPAQVEQMTFVIHGLRETAHYRITLDDDAGTALAGEFVGGGQAGGARAQNDHIGRGRFLRAIPRGAIDWVYHQFLRSLRVCGISAAEGSAEDSGRTLCQPYDAAPSTKEIPL